MKILGIDPGVYGGLAIVALNDRAAPQLITAIDIPVVGTGAKERVDVIAIRNWIARYQPVHAYIERAQAMRKQGMSSGFKYGRATGAIESVLACCEIPTTVVERIHAPCNVSRASSTVESTASEASTKAAAMETATTKAAAVEAATAKAASVTAATTAASGQRGWLNQADSHRCEQGYNRFPHHASFLGTMSPPKVKHFRTV